MYHLCSVYLLFCNHLTPNNYNNINLSISSSRIYGQITNRSLRRVTPFPPSQIIHPSPLVSSSCFVLGLFISLSLSHPVYFVDFFLGFLSLGQDGTWFTLSHLIGCSPAPPPFPFDLICFPLMQCLFDHLPIPSPTRLGLSIHPCSASSLSRLAR